MDPLAVILSVLAIGFVATTLYVVRIALTTARETAEATARLAESNTAVVSEAVKDAVTGIVEAIGTNFQGVADTAAQTFEPDPEQTADQLGGPEGPVWMDWTFDDIPDEGRLPVGDPAIDPIPGVPTPDLSGEEFGG